MSKSPALQGPGAVDVTEASHSCQIRDLPAAHQGVDPVGEGQEFGAMLIFNAIVSNFGLIRMRLTRDLGGVIICRSATSA